MHLAGVNAGRIHGCPSPDRDVPLQSSRRLIPSQTNAFGLLRESVLAKGSHACPRSGLLLTSVLHSRWPFPRTRRRAPTSSPTITTRRSGESRSRPCQHHRHSEARPRRVHDEVADLSAAAQATLCERSSVSASRLESWPPRVGILPIMCTVHTFDRICSIAEWSQCPDPSATNSDPHAVGIGPSTYCLTDADGPDIR